MRVNLPRKDVELEDGVLYPIPILACLQEQTNLGQQSGRRTYVPNPIFWDMYDKIKEVKK